MINTRKLTKSEKHEIISLMESAGFALEISDPDTEKLLTSLFFTIPISPDDLKNTLARLAPNHFTPRGYRSVAVFTSYVTSNIRGTFRGYKCRNEYSDYDTSNIFAYTSNGNDTPVENVRLFLEMYKNLQYNQA